MTRIAILVGGKTLGTNMEALARACQSGELAAEVALVVAPRADCPAAEAAKGLRLPLQVLSAREDGYEERLTEALQCTGAAYVCLSGYLSLLPQAVLQAFPNRILNIHPALLPKFGGKGMYGLAVHRAVVEAGETESGCTVHWVTEQYDEGPILLQRSCPVLPEDTPESLAARVLSLEHVAYRDALQTLILRNGT
jgi:formyltetrahydrofolate-dependent phosphoribosylglycinamide formyltransferase